MLKDFQERAMQLVTGQMPLPQGVFRQFLNEYLEATESDNTQDVLDSLDGRLELLGVRVSDTESGVTDNRSTIEKLVDILSGLTTSIQQLDKRLVVKNGKLYVRYNDKIYQCDAVEAQPEEVEYITIYKFNGAVKVNNLKCYRDAANDTTVEGVQYKAWTSNSLVELGNTGGEATYYTTQEQEEAGYIDEHSYTFDKDWNRYQWTTNKIVDYGKELVDVNLEE